MSWAEKLKTSLSHTADWKVVLEIRQNEIKESANYWDLAKLYATRKLLSKESHGILTTYIFDVLPVKNKQNA